MSYITFFDRFEFSVGKSRGPLSWIWSNVLCMPSSVLAMRGVLGGKHAAPLLWKSFQTCSGVVVSAQFHHQIEGTKVLWNLSWVVDGMLRHFGGIRFQSACEKKKVCVGESRFGMHTSHASSRDALFLPTQIPCDAAC